MIKSFIKGLLIGCGILLPLVIVGGVYASQMLFHNQQDIGKYDVTPQGYSFTWTPADESCLEMSVRLGVQVNQIQKNGIVVGYMNDPHHTQIIKQGMIITFDKLPTSAITDKLDYQFGILGFNRTGGKSVVGTLLKADTIKVLP